MAEAGVELDADRSPEEWASEFAVLYQQQWRPMLRLAVGLVDEVALAEEVVQDAFTALFHRAGDLRAAASVTAYLRVSVLNASRSVLRRRRTARAHPVEAWDEPVPGADHTALLSAEQEIVRRALATLPQRQRHVLSLRYLAEAPDTEIARVTGLSLPGVRSAASRGLATLRHRLGEEL